MFNVERVFYTPFFDNKLVATSEDNYIFNIYKQSNTFSDNYIDSVFEKEIIASIESSIREIDPNLIAIEVNIPNSIVDKVDPIAISNIQDISIYKNEEDIYRFSFYFNSFSETSEEASIKNQEIIKLLRDSGYKDSSVYIYQFNLKENQKANFIKDLTKLERVIVLEKFKKDFKREIFIPREIIRDFESLNKN